MNRGPFAIALVAVVVVVVAVVWLLMSGEPGDSPARRDDEGDVAIESGPASPKEPSIADIVSADVSSEGEQLSFVAELATDVPRRLPRGSLELRYEIGAGDELEWILTATVNVEATASLIATERDYSSSTIDGSLPGDVAISGRAVTVTLRPGRVSGFPTDFRWHLETTLDADRGKVRSARATDRVPDRGSLPL